MGREKLGEDYFRLLVEAAHEYAIFGTDSQGKVISWNAGAERLLQFREEEILGQSAEVIYTPEDRARNVPAGELRRAAERGCARDERWHLKRDGTRFWGVGIVHPVREEDRLVGFVKIIRDRTDQKLAIDKLKALAAKLEHQKKWLRGVMNCLPVGLVLFEAETGRPIFANRAADEAVGGSLLRMHPSINPDYYCTDENGNRMPLEELPGMRAARGEATGPEGPVEVTWHGPKGRRNLRIDSAQIEPEEGMKAAAVCILSDVTEQKQTWARMENSEARLREVTEELTRSNRELEQFAYVASHDLQEPLRMISSYVGLLVRKLDDKLDPQSREYVNYVLDGTRRMRALIDSLLAYARRGAEKENFRPVSCAQALQAALRNLSVAVQESGARVEWQSLPTVCGDPVQITQLFQNLVGNAIKFRREEPPEIRVSCDKVDGSWLLCVRDNGIGFATQYAADIFQPFRRLHGKHEYAGSGIGLALCRKIVERHGGKIWAESEPGKGSVFRFTLPAGKEDDGEVKSGN